ncbi:hypothetical protein LF20_9 [Klebsiella phage LF20]|uniref:Uncharacterized protein n=1 Tax=Klebsiella phage LF20 TaxID=2794827 RepID=A0A7T8EN72_9CAUD|nr:hypothetical protein LF20_9 [Klebsiella phage LF20]
MNDNLIALLEELNSYGCAYIELSSEHVIEVMIDDDAWFTKLRVATGAEEEFEECGIREVTNLLEVHQVKEIR